MKILAVVLSAVLLLAVSVQAGNEVLARVHAATHKIYLPSSLLEGRTCSATSIGPHALLAASHCEEPSSDIFVDRDRVKVLGLVRDGNDHTVYLIDHEFKIWVPIVGVPLEQGDHVFIIGNPGEQDNVYREGYVAGFRHDRDGEVVLYDLNGFKGDSGSAIFNVSGQVTGVLGVAIVDKDKEAPEWTFKLMGGMPLAYTQIQLVQFQNWKPGDAMPTEVEKKRLHFPQVTFPRVTK